MKRILCVVFSIVLMVLMVTACSSPSKTVDYMVDTIPQNGQEFFKGNYYQTVEETTLTVPSTYEATLFLPTTAQSSSGVLFGTFNGEFTSPFLNFEILRGGIPHLYMVADDEEGTFYDVQFDSVNVCTGKPLHLAITVDHEQGVWKCYVDGELTQTVETAAPTPFTFSSKARLGCDMRGQDDVRFTGILQSLAFYKNVRTDKQIAKDVKRATFDKRNLLFGLDMSKTVTGEYPKTIEAVGNKDFTMAAHLLWIKNYEEPKEYDYSFAVLGDIQTLTYNHPDKLGEMYDWIVANAESKKIEYCIGLGDITDQNLQREYDVVNQQYEKLLGKVPFSLIRGNHDREQEAQSAMFEQNITQEKYGTEITGSYDSTMLNTYRILTIGQEKYMFLNLDFALKAETLEWANTVIAENADCRVIVSTHIYMNNKGAYIEGVSHTKYGCETGGQELWDKVISQHKNIVMILVGHSPAETNVIQEKTGVHGNKVMEILVDPQYIDRDYGAAGLVAMFYFSNGGKNVDIRYYSTINDAYFKEENQVSIQLEG